MSLFISSLQIEISTAAQSLCSKPNSRWRQTANFTIIPESTSRPSINSKFLNSTMLIEKNILQQRLQNQHKVHLSIRTFVLALLCSSLSSKFRAVRMTDPKDQRSIRCLCFFISARYESNMSSVHLYAFLPQKYNPESGHQIRSTSHTSRI